MNCTNCGTQITEPARFCPRCGAPVQAAPSTEPAAQSAAPTQQGTYSAQPQQGLPQYQAASNIPVNIQPPKKRSALPFIIIGAVLLAAVVLVVVLSGTPAALPEVTYTYLEKTTEPVLSYKAEEIIFPSLYRSLNSIVTFTGTSEGEELDVLISVEIPGFTQPYEQKTKLNRQITKINIHPPLLTGDIDLSSEKDAQLVISVKDMDSGKLLLQDSKTIRIMSKYDVVWWSEELRDSNNDNILAYMTPESEGVLELKREAVDYLSYITDGAANSIVGYQDYGIWSDPTNNTWVQAVALQGAMSDIAKIRYNNAAFSISSESQQRVMLPDDVMKSQSGICIETSLLMASALQSAGMHCMLIFPPGHAQVAVECLPGTGEYFLIETTVLPLPMDEEWYNYVVMYLTPDEWQGYIDGTGGYTLGECYVLDCDLGKKLNILPMSN